MHEVRSPLDPRDLTVVVAMPSEERPMRPLVPQLRVPRYCRRAALVVAAALAEPRAR